MLLPYVGDYRDEFAFNSSSFRRERVQPISAPRAPHDAIAAPDERERRSAADPG